MFDIDFSSKRAKLALRFFTYGVMTVATIVISTFMIFFALGYRFDNNFQFTQGGLVQFRSFPENAEITVDGAKQNFKTPNKLNLGTGHHSVAMSLEGYRAWSKDFDLAAGQLLWLNYTRFIPTTVATNNVKEFSTLAASSASPDRHWLLLQEKLDSPQFILADISNEKEPKFTPFPLPDPQLTKVDNKLGNFTIIEWDLDSRFVLVKHQNGPITEFLRVDRSKPAESINLSTVFGLSIREAHFSGSDANIVFANTDGVLRRLDVGSKNASGALVNNLRQFALYGPGYVAFSRDQERTAGDPASTQQIIGILRGDKTTTVRTVPKDQQMIFAYSEYDSHDYLAIGQADSSRIDIIRDPSNSGTKDANGIFAQYDLGVPLRWLSFSNNGRMVVAQNNNDFATYDLEESRSYRKTLNVGAAITAPLRWLDDFYLWSDAGGDARIVEFDGANERDITGVTPGIGIVLSGNGKRLFSVSKSDATGSFYLQASKLTIND